MTIPPPPPPLVLAAGRLKALGAAGRAAAVERSSSKRPALLLRPMTMPDRCAGCGGGGWGRVLGNVVSPAKVARTKMVMITITISLNSDVFALLCNYKLIYISNHQNLLGETYTLDTADKKAQAPFHLVNSFVFTKFFEINQRIRRNSFYYWAIYDIAETAVVKNLSWSSVLRPSLLCLSAKCECTVLRHSFLGGGWGLKQVHFATKSFYKSNKKGRF